MLIQPQITKAFLEICVMMHHNVKYIHKHIQIYIYTHIYKAYKRDATSYNIYVNTYWTTEPQIESERKQKMQIKKKREKKKLKRSMWSNG